MIEKSFTIVEAPSVLGLFPKAVETLPEALLAAGLAERLGARRAGPVEPPPYEPERDPETMLLTRAALSNTPSRSPMPSARSSAGASSRWCSAATARSCSATFWR